MKVEKRKKYEIGDIVYSRHNGMPGTYKIMSSEKLGLLGKYYLIRYNKKDYARGLPDRRTERLYKRNIGGIVRGEKARFILLKKGEIEENVGLLPQTACGN